jgi:hypothetical protein
MSRITVLHPAYEEAGPAMTGLARRAPLEGPGVLTLIDNGKPKAREILSAIAEELRRTYPLLRVDLHSKPSAAAPIDADTAQLLAARSRVVITGLGD